MILLGTLTALHYGERTAARFVFPTALVVVILLARPLCRTTPSTADQARCQYGRDRAVDRARGGTIVIILILGS